MKLVFGEDEAIAAYVGAALGIDIHPPCTAIGFEHPVKGIVGGAVFNCYNGSNIELTMVLPKVSRGIIRALAHYAFIQLKVTRVTARTKRSNARVRRILPKLGFAFEFPQVRYFGPNRADDALVFRLDPEIAKMKWLKGFAHAG